MTINSRFLRARNALASASLLLAITHTACLHSQLLPPVTAADGDTRQSYSQEDLHVVGLHEGHLMASAPVPGGTESTGSFVRELYQMQWRNGDPIDVYVIRPIGVAKPPVTIYLYGYPVDANRFSNDEFCRLATLSGGAAIGFVPALTGQRYHGVGMKTWFVSDLHDSLVKSVHDLQMLIDYAQSREDLDGSRIGIFGQGAGATIAGLAATVDKRILAVDLLDPWGDWPHWVATSSLVPEKERAALLKPEFLDPLDPLDPLRWLPSLSGRQLKLDDALFETGTMPDSKRRIEAALPSSALLARYSTKAEFQEEALADGKLLSWMSKQLKRQLSMTAPPSSLAAPLPSTGDALRAPVHSSLRE